jgi:hypothetical protein
MLTSEAKAILQLLVNFIRAGRFNPNDERSFIGYKELHDSLRLDRKVPHWGKSARLQGLEDLARWLHQADLPAITGLIVNRTNSQPGDGYFELFGRPDGDREWWAKQVRRSIAFDWSPYVNDDPTPTLDDLLAFTRAVVEGELSTVPVEVRSRCEALRTRARHYYRDADGLLRCEVCCWYKPDDRISGDIVELHHIRPLAELLPDGVRLTLNDAIQSLAPLCPCCHRIAHSHIGGRIFTLDELKTIIPRRTAV